MAGVKEVEEGGSAEKGGFERSIVASRNLQIRAITALTALLYVIYNLMERLIAPQETLPLVTAVHLYINAPMLLAISFMTLSKRTAPFVLPALFLSPLIAAAGHLAIVATLRQHALLYLPEIYLMLFWIFTVSGLGLRSATLAALLVLGLTEYGTTLITLPELIYWSHQFWLLAAFSFGLLGAWLLESSRKKIYENHLQLQKQAAELEEMAVTDTLTGLYNRGKFDEMLQYEMQRTERYKGPMGLILMDIDHFKRINDTHGHPVGDRILVEMAELLKRNTRVSDTIGRWGGEEFAIICPETDEAGTRKLAEHLRLEIAGHDFEHIGKTQTASCGVTMLQKDDTPASIVKRSDDALYLAKDSGRNSVVCL